MIIKNYDIKDRYIENNDFIYYKAINIDDNKEYIIKTYNKELDYIKNKILKKEYNISRQLDNKKFINYIDLIELNNKLYLVLKEKDIMSLQEYLKSKNILDIDEFLYLTIQIMEALSFLEAKNLNFKEIIISNIYISKSINKIKIGDLGYLFEDEEEEVRYKNVYDLGILIFNILCNDFSFKKDFIIKRKDVNNRLKSLIYNMININSKKKYKNIKTLEEEFKHVYLNTDNTLLENENIKLESNQNNIFKLSNKIYNLDQKINETVDKINKFDLSSKELFIITGKEGEGKTTFANELEKKLKYINGYFVRGNFENNDFNIPYKGVIEVLKSIINKVLNTDIKKREEIKKELKNILGKDISFLVNFIPEFKNLLDDDYKYKDIDSKEKKYRLKKSLKDILRVFIMRDEYLIIFLDNLHFIDKDSLDIILDLFGSASAGKIVVIGAVKLEFNINSSNLFLDNLKEGFDINYINLKPFNKKTINLFLKDSFLQYQVIGRDFTNIILKRTNGNPLFIKMFLESLYAKGIIYFDKMWTIDCERIKENQDKIHDYISTEFINRIYKFNKKSLEILKIASCLGFSFKLEDISKVISQNEAYVQKYLKPIILNGILKTSKGDEYIFSNNLIYKNIYNIMSAEEKNEKHFLIGKALLDKYHDDKKSKDIFNLAKHMNLSKNLIEENKRDLIKINLIGSKEAKDNMAYNNALDYINQAVLYINKNLWEEEYELCKNVFNELIDISFLNNMQKNMETMAFDILNNLKTIEDKVLWLNNIAVKYFNIGKYDKSILFISKSLEYFDINMENKTVRKSYLKEYNILKLSLKKRDINRIKESDLIKDKGNILIMKSLIIALDIFNFNTYKYTFNYLVCKWMNMTLNYGIYEETPYGLFLYLNFLIFEEKNYKDVYNILDYTFELAEILGFLGQKVKIIYSYYKNLMGLIKYLRWDENYLKENIKLCELGDKYNYLSSLYSINLDIVYKNSMNLEEMEGILFEYYEFARERDLYKLKLKINMYFIILNNYFDINKNLFTDMILDEEKLMEKFKFFNFTKEMYYYYLIVLETLYIFKKHDEGMEFIKKIQREVLNSKSIFLKYEFLYYKSLFLLENFETIKDVNLKKKYWNEIEINKKFIKTLDEEFSNDYKYRYYFIEARMCDISKDYFNAIKLYEKVSLLLKNTNQNREKAIINEEIGRFFLRLEHFTFAKAYLKESYRNYYLFGAKKKIISMEEEYINILQGFLSKRFTNSNLNSNDQDDMLEDNKNMLDFILHSLKNLDEKNIYNLYMKKIKELINPMKLIFIVKERDFRVKIFHFDKTYILDDSLSNYQNIAKTIIEYSFYTGENILFPNSYQEEIFKYDDYLKKTNPKCLASIPIAFEGQIKAVLYFEKESSKEVFEDYIFEEILKYSYNLIYLIMKKEEFSFNYDKNNIVKNVSQEILNGMKENVNIMEIMKRNILRDKIDKNFIKNLDVELSFVIESFYSMINKIEGISNKIESKDENKELFFLRDLVDDILINMREKIKRNNYKVNIDIKDDIEVYSYKNLFENILKAFIINSISHEKQELKESNINIIVSEDNLNLYIRYLDDEISVEDDELENVFEPFFKSKNKKRSILGLDKVKNIVDKNLNGKIICQKDELDKMSYLIEIPFKYLDRDFNEVLNN